MTDAYLQQQRTEPRHMPTATLRIGDRELTEQIYTSNDSGIITGSMVKPVLREIVWRTMGYFESTMALELKEKHHVPDESVKRIIGNFRKRKLPKQATHLDKTEQVLYQTVFQNASDNYLREDPRSGDSNFKNVVKIATYHPLWINYQNNLPSVKEILGEKQGLGLPAKLLLLGLGAATLGACDLCKPPVLVDNSPEASASANPELVKAGEPMNYHIKLTDDKGIKSYHIVHPDGTPGNVPVEPAGDGSYPTSIEFDVPKTFEEDLNDGLPQKGYTLEIWAVDTKGQQSPIVKATCTVDDLLLSDIDFESFLIGWLSSEYGMSLIGYNEPFDIMPYDPITDTLGEEESFVFNFLMNYLGKDFYVGTNISDETRLEQIASTFEHPNSPMPGELLPIWAYVPLEHTKEQAQGKLAQLIAGLPE